MASEEDSHSKKRELIKLIIIMLIKQKCLCPLTLLQDLQVLPENITGEWWRNGQEAVSSQRDHLPSLQVVEWTKVETLQRELFDSPLQPTQYVLLSPLARIWNGMEKCISLSCSLNMQYSQIRHIVGDADNKKTPTVFSSSKKFYFVIKFTKH